jgi:glucose-6-phosphate-specific signal transduction histidine kinase
MLLLKIFFKKNTLSSCIYLNKIYFKKNHYRETTFNFLYLSPIHSKSFRRIPFPLSFTLPILFPSRFIPKQSVIRLFMIVVVEQQQHQSWSILICKLMVYLQINVLSISYFKKKYSWTTNIIYIGLSGYRSRF